jgi:integrase
MLRLIKKHLAACKKKSEKDWKCTPKSAGSRVACPFYVVGPDPRDRTAPRIKQYTNTGDERLAKAFLLEFELALYQKPKPEPLPPPPPKTLAQAVEYFLGTKKHKSTARQQKLRRQLTLMCDFLRERFQRHHVTDVQKTDLESFMNSWDGKYTTLKTSRENLKSFWKYCFDSDFIPKNIAAALPTVGDERVLKARRIPTLTPKEVETIINAASKSEAIFKREGEKIARQVLGFTLVEKYTGLAIGEVAKLRLDELNGTTLLVNRKKTGEPVFTTLPPFVVSALHAFAPDSPEYFFWSGRGKLHTRTSKWGVRLQKLYVFANVRVKDVEKRRRSGGKLKEKPELVKVSEITPHWWRHTFVRDCYLRKPPVPVETIADLLGDDVDTVREYYSSFDELRQNQLKSEMELMWANDPLTQRLAVDPAFSESTFGSRTPE